jgi:hypothetical protein
MNAEDLAASRFRPIRVHADRDELVDGMREAAKRWAAAK